MSVGADSFGGLTRYYSEAHGAGPALVAAFRQARGDFIYDDIEWVEPFGTLRGAEVV